MNFAAGQAAAGAVSASAMALAREVLRSMLLSKLRFLAISFLFLGAAATGAGYWKHSLAMKDEPVKNPASHTTQHAAMRKPRDEDQPYPATKPDAAMPGRMFVSRSRARSGG